jgi:membrane protein YqaA with SNARE-associated domain
MLSSKSIVATVAGGLLGYVITLWLDRRRERERQEDAQTETDLYRQRGGRAR